MVRSGDLPVLINISNDSNFERFKKLSDGANIKGNDYRLVAALQYRAGALAIRFFGTHSEYDRIDAETV